MSILILCGVFFALGIFRVLPADVVMGLELLCAVWLFYRYRHNDETFERDRLTGLLVRRRGEELFNKLFQVWRRYLKQPLSVIIVDGDGLKKINDVFGHECGDLMIASLGDICCQGVRNADVAYRMGGEEFVIACPHTTIAQAAELAERLRQKLDTEIEFGGKKIKVSASLGVATAVAAHQGFSDLVAAADAALYEAKRTGKNKVVLAAV